MRAVVQRVQSASVTVDGQVVGAIDRGLLVLVCALEGDTQDDADWLCRKLVALRVFADANGKMNLALSAVPATKHSGMLVVSQFTLAAELRPKTAKGNRPSFTQAMQPELAERLVGDCVVQLRAALAGFGHSVACGRFGADMAVALVNDGPVTLVFDSRDLQGATDG